MIWPGQAHRLFLVLSLASSTKIYPLPYFPLQAQAKRAAIRNSWMRDVQRLYPNVAVKFVLAQPATPAELAQGIELLSDEIHQFADIIIVPGGRARGWRGIFLSGVMRVSCTHESSMLTPAISRPARRPGPLPLPAQQDAAAPQVRAFLPVQVHAHPEDGRRRVPEVGLGVEDWRRFLGR